MQGGTKARTGAYEAVREDAGLKFQRRRRPLSTDQGQVYAVIMAGGKGTRFWPLSRPDRPKQLLKILSQRTLISETLRRITPPFRRENVLVVTAAEHFKEVRKELRDLPTRNLLLEPQGNNTAPCIGLAAIEVAARNPNALMAVFPADHWITDPYKFRETVRAALKLAQETDALVTVGIQPAYPETGYGYIRKGRPVLGSRGVAAYQVNNFQEKPNHTKAVQLIRAGSLWNSGIFIWKASTILKLLQRFSPRVFQGLTEIQKARGTGLGGIPRARLLTVLRREYRKMPAISIDQAVLEKAGATGKVLTVKADFGWSDVGSWASLHRLLPHDSRGNAAVGDWLAVDAKGCLVFSPHRLVVLLGMRNTVVVDSPNALLVADRERTQEIREVVRRLQKKGYQRYLTGSSGKN